MDYQALYRKYRPQSFDDVVGQGHVTATLAREVTEGRVAHAYLFTGPRGTGKTTTARILAKALNCADRAPDGSPCNQCESCLAIIEGSSFDVMELDAASHNSVEDIRDIRMSVTTVAAHAGSRRVFILDEAHMLSKAAGNALLKTLEEPPEHVHFVLATTEPYKLLDTIRSRSQRFDFHPIGVEALAAHLGRIADLEGYKADPAALVAVCRHAGGSARDSLSLLEQVAALGNGVVDGGGVRRALGLADSEAFSRLATAIGSHDASSSLHLVAELASEGVDLRRFVAEGISFFRGVFLAHYAPNLEEIADEPSDVLDAWRRTAAELPAVDVLRAVDVLGEALVRLREGRDERLMVELALIKLSRPEVTSDPDAMAARIGRLERRVENLGDAPVAAGSPTGSGAAARPAPQAPARPEPQPQSATPGADFPAPAADAPFDDSASGAGGSPTDSPRTDPTAGTAEPEGAAAGSTESAASSGPPAGAEPSPASSSSSPPAGSSGQSSDGGDVPLQMAQLQSIWPGLFGGLRDVLGARRWALFREVVPAGVDGAAIILTVPHLFHLEALQEDPAVAKVVATKAGDLLGRPVQVRFAAQDGSPAAGHVAEADEVEEVDLSTEQLVDAPADDVDPTKLLEEELGAELIDDNG